MQLLDKFITVCLAKFAKSELITIKDVIRKQNKVLGKIKAG